MAKLFKVIDKQLYLGQGCENVYWYATSTNSVTSLAVGNAFNAQIIANLRNLQSNVLTHESLYVKEMLSGTDIVDGAQTGANAGTLGTDPQSAFDSFSFGLVPTSGLIRKGSKRYAGLAEGSTTTGLLTTAFKVALGLFASQVVSSIVLPTFSAILYPVIVRVTDSPAGGWLASQIIGWVANELTTQNSRKKGSGGGPLSFGDGVNLFQYDDVLTKATSINNGGEEVDDSTLKYGLNSQFAWLFLPRVAVAPTILA